MQQDHRFCSVSHAMAALGPLFLPNLDNKKMEIGNQSLQNNGRWEWQTHREGRLVKIVSEYRFKIFK